MNKLTYKAPARLWREALPLGNGFTGVMVFGSKRTEKLCFNDSTLWSGFPKEQNNPESLKYLDEVRKLVFEGKNAEADKLCMDKLCGAYSESYLPLCSLSLTFSKQKYNNYIRELDLETAVHSVRFDGVRREAFCSNPDRVFVYRIESYDKFSLDISAESKLHYEIISDDALNICGNAPDYVAPNYLRTERNPIRYDEGKGMSFCLRCEVQTDGQMTCEKGRIFIHGAKTVALYITTATGFKGFSEMPETNRTTSLESCKKALAAFSKDYKAVKLRHIEDYRSIYKKHLLSLATESKATADSLIKSAKNGEASLALCELLYNYGKYMMISGSRENGQALNLQGIWNNSVRPPWSSNYTVNINTQMNYWALTKSNLSECAEPYIRLVKSIMKNGTQTARVNYGCNGFCCNHNVDIWGKTSPVKGDPAYMYAPLCGAWLANELYAHYKTGGLEKYKNDILEILTESVQFINDYLVLKDGYYVTAPSASPEIGLISGGKGAALDYASTFEMSIVRQAFKNYLEFGNDSLCDAIKEKQLKLYPVKCREIGINEWHADFPVNDKGHRHFSPLYGFYPGNTIGYYSNPRQTEWVKKLFEYRISNSKQYIGWSAAWAICICGRLHDAKTASEIIESMLSHSVFKNLFCVHPPFLFQIDGNMGYVAGVNELLVYEENGVIDLLPALPGEWQNGEVKNIVVNGSEISFKWRNGKVTDVCSDKPVTVRNINLSDCVQKNETVEII